jgi:hypothetical protein
MVIERGGCNKSEMEVLEELSGGNILGEAFATMVRK